MHLEHFYLDETYYLYRGRRSDESPIKGLAPILDILTLSKKTTSKLHLRATPPPPMFASAILFGQIMMF